MKEAHIPDEQGPASSQSMARPALITLRARMALSFGLLFAIIVIVISLIRTFGIPWTTDEGTYGDAQTLVLRQLSLVADLKQELLQHWLEERQMDATALSQRRVVTSSVTKLVEITRKHSELGSTGDAIRAELLNDKSGKELTDALRMVIKSQGGYRKIQIAAAENGIVIASTEDRDVGANVSSQEVFADSLNAVEGPVTHVTTSAVTGKTALVISKAIFEKLSPEAGEEVKVTGVATLYVDESDFSKRIMFGIGGVGDTAEVVLVNQDRRIITPLKYPLLDGSQAKLLEYRIKTQPATLAAEGKEGIIVSKDYRGVPVLAAYRHIEAGPDTSWGLVIKVDRYEILGVPRKRLLHASLISLLGVLAATAMAAVIAGRIARPIQILSRAAREVEAGNLNAHADVVAQDEIGNLASTFNSMIERVRNWHEDLETQVRNRTIRLAELNEELIREVSERKHGEEKIRQQNDFLKSVLESLSHPFYVIDASDYTVTMANSAAGKDQISSASTCYALTHGRNKPCRGEDHPCPCEEVRQTGRPALAEHVHYDKAGNARHVEVHAYPILDAAGTVVQVIEYSFDITDRKRIEQEREALLEELGAKNAELERFTYTVSHDLKSPLITIKGFLGYLEQDVLSGNLERAKADSARIQGAVEKMGRLLDELLELSRIGRIMNPPQEVALGVLVQESVDSLAGRIAERGVTVDIAEDLPVIYGDAVRLREVVENLLDNAVKFMGDQPYPSIEIGVRRGSDRTVIYFKDNGKGIDPRYHTKIFGLFERLAQDGEGTGIGLAIVKRIVEVHGGEIWVESEGIGRGSVFSFTLPGVNETKKGRR